MALPFFPMKSGLLCKPWNFLGETCFTLSASFADLEILFMVASLRQYYPVQVMRVKSQHMRTPSNLWGFPPRNHYVIVTDIKYLCLN